MLINWNLGILPNDLEFLSGFSNLKKKMALSLKSTEEQEIPNLNMWVIFKRDIEEKSCRENTVADT